MADPIRGDLHTRLVIWAKIGLPLLALAILSTLFLFSHRIGGEGQLPYAEVDLQQMASSQQLSAPEVAGVTEDGASVTVRARAARPAQGDAPATVDQVAARYVATDGLTVELRAESGRLAGDGASITLDRGVEMTTSAGYRLTAADLTAEMNRTVVRTGNPVQAEAPFGRIEAGGMVLSPDPQHPEAQLLVFNRGVRMLYQPGN
jgi:lipopolysaccharide export system protein LptC